MTAPLCPGCREHPRDTTDRYGFCPTCNDWGYIAYGDDVCPCDCAAGAWVKANGIGSVKTPEARRQIAAIRAGRQAA